MRNCRLCLKSDVLDNMVSCFDNIEIIKDLSYIANISMVEIDGSPAKICKRCEKSIKLSADFIRMIKESDQQFKKTSNEHFIWFENLRELKNTPLNLEIDTKNIIEPTTSKTNTSPIPSTSKENIETVPSTSKDNNHLHDSKTNECSDFEKFILEADDLLGKSFAEIDMYDEKIVADQNITNQIAHFELKNNSLEIECLDFIDRLNNKQLKELTNEIACLMDIEEEIPTVKVPNKIPVTKSQNQNGISKIKINLLNIRELRFNRKTRQVSKMSRIGTNNNQDYFHVQFKGK